MTDTANPGARDTFDRLLAAMPRIADAVNAFTSEKNQRAALYALVSAMGVAPRGPSVAGAAAVSITTPDLVERPVEGDVAGVADEVASPVAVAGRKRRSSTRKWEPVRDIDFRPEGKVSLRDLVAEKQPASIDQKNIIAVWWLEQIAGLAEIGVGHVMAAYKECSWREPAHPDNALQVTASRAHWLDTKNMKAIVTTPSGRNVVQFDMPLKKDKAA